MPAIDSRKIGPFRHLQKRKSVQKDGCTAEYEVGHKVDSSMADNSIVVLIQPFAFNLVYQR